MLAEQRRLEHRRRLEEQRWLEEKQRLEEHQKIKEEIRLQAIKRRNERKQRLNRRMQQLEEKQKMMKERIRQFRSINEQKVVLLCESMPGPCYYVGSKTRIKKQFKLRNVLKKKAGVWLRRVHDNITKRNTENHALKRKRKLRWILMKNNPYSKFDYLRSNTHTPKLNGAEIDTRIQQSLDEDYIILGLGTSRRIWHQMKNFNVKYPNTSQKLNWQLIICIEDTQVESSAWFKRNFNLADEFLSNVNHYATPSITSRMVIENTYPIIRPISSEIGGIVFSIPEQKGTETSEESFLGKMLLSIGKSHEGDQLLQSNRKLPDPADILPSAKRNRGGIEHDPAFVGAVEIQKYFRLLTPINEVGNSGDEDCGQSKPDG
ncbi:hypothetical protein G6F42_013596 [Rhizopus arrhizus]|nr:hypothetical protein G6F42_013596 [Rhizopus arrhizus]